ncbi:MAG: membrane protein insertion efficiency factor YidD [Alphaproteobacteria bacterium]
MNRIADLLRSVPAVLLRALVRGYQLFISPVLGANCRFDPTCSAYAHEAIGRFGAVRGTFLALKRVSRCHPWGGFGHDPVPERAPPKRIMHDV